jgi:hemolysin III
MPKTTPPREQGDPPFNLWLFAATVVGSSAFLLTVLRFAAPPVWQSQFLAAPSRAVAAFLLLSLVNCFVEYVFHRYVLHKPAVPFLSRFYRQHTLHHALTRIGRRPAKDGRSLLIIENKYPILENEQHEASFFPWYTMVVFAAIYTPFLALLQLSMPSFPWFFSGLAALASSLTLYEVVHAIEHWSLDFWVPLIENPVWGRFWRRAYSFHLRHHAVIDSNESISGFFCLPLADWAFGTCIMPSTIYVDGDEPIPTEFESPHPIWPIRMLDRAADGAVQSARAAAPAAPAVQTQGETIATWVTHALGLVVSILALGLLVFSANAYGDPWRIVSFSVFGATLLLLYTLYTLYLAWQTQRGKRVFRTLGRASAFLLVAGTYTPFLLVSMRGALGWTLFGIIWGLCGLGAIFQIIVGDRYRVTTTLATLFLGWMVLVAIKPVVASVPQGGVLLLLAGGLLYTAGSMLQPLTKLRYRSAFRNTLVLGGSTCHLLAVLIFLLPHHA